MIEKIRKENEGITLIALVITIIVLLILAGVAIVTLTGENGILTQAGDAKTETNNAEAEEQINLLSHEWIIEKNTSSKTLEEFLNEKIEEGKLSSVKKNEDGTYTIKLNGYQTIIDQDGKISSIFNLEEWDKTACKESSFLWESDDPASGESYHKIIGYADSITNEIKLKIPSRCHEIRSNGGNWNSVGRTFSANNFTNIELPDTLKKIEDNAFSRFISLTDITIPDSVTYIGGSAFEGCTSLSSIEIPNSVTSIGFSAFEGCTSLSSITIPDNLTSVGNETFENTAWYNNQPDGVVYLGKILYKYKGVMPSNTNIVIPSSVTSIGCSAFDGCTSLSSIEIPNSVTSIEYEAFSGCTSLSSITIPNSVTTIGWGVFHNWNSSQTINIQGYSSAPTGWSGVWSYGCSAQINWNQ